MWYRLHTGIRSLLLYFSELSKDCRICFRPLSCQSIPLFRSLSTRYFLWKTDRTHFVTCGSASTGHHIENVFGSGSQKVLFGALCSMREREHSLTCRPLWHGSWVRNYQCVCGKLTAALTHQVVRVLRVGGHKIRVFNGRSHF